MKYDEIEFYVDELFRRLSSPQEDDQPSFDDRLSSVEQAIGDAYDNDNAMRWHSAQIEGDKYGWSDSEKDTAFLTGWQPSGYEHWSEPASPPLRRYPTPRVKVVPGIFSTDDDDDAPAVDGSISLFGLMASVALFCTVAVLIVIGLAWASGEAQGAIAGFVAEVSAGGEGAYQEQSEEEEYDYQAYDTYGPETVTFDQAGQAAYTEAGGDICTWYAARGGADGELPEECR